MLQAQSAESRMCSRELRNSSCQLKHRVKTLRAYKAALQRKHTAARSVMLKNEEALMREKMRPPSDTPNREKSLRDTWDTLKNKVKSLQEMRAKHLMEVQLFKQSADERLGAAPEITSTVLELMRKQLLLYETQIAAHTFEEKALEERFAKEVCVAMEGEEKVRGELERLRKEGKRDWMREMVMKRRLLIAESVPAPENGKIVTSAPDQSSQSTRDLLINLKIRLGSSSGRMLK